MLTKPDFLQLGILCHLHVKKTLLEINSQGITSQLGKYLRAAKPQARWLNSAHLLLQGYTALPSPITFCLSSQTCRNIIT